jgi:hypothetical protein
MVLAAVLAASYVNADLYCTFFSDQDCKTRSGSLDYDANNDGIFQNGGTYFACHNGPTRVSLTEYPPGDSAGDNPDNCHYFLVEEDLTCSELTAFGFHPGNGGYYRLGGGC